MLITFYDSYNILNKVYSQGMFIKEAINSTLIEEKNRSYTNKIVYGVLDKDIQLTYIISKLCDKNPKLPIRLILKISLYNIIFLEKAPYAVVDSAVELVKKLGKGGMSGFTNAVLRKYIREGVKYPTDEVENLSIKYSYPQFILLNIIKDYGIEIVQKIISYDDSFTYIRFNKGIDGNKYLTDKEVNFNQTPFNNLFDVKGQKMDDDFRNGVYTFQSIGSVAICDMVGEGFNLLDTCAAPGGKSVYLSEKFESVTSLDIHPHRVELISSYMGRMRRDNIKVMVWDSTKENCDFVDKFDTVLCDVPCSGTGVMKDNPDIKLNREENNIVELNKTQYDILLASSKYVKNDGYLCYSTCSILKRENEKIIDKFLKNNKNFIEVKVQSPLEHMDLDYGIQFLPHISCGAGFYFCKLKRVN